MTNTLQHNNSSDTTATPPDPALILEIGMGFWASKTLLSAVELRVFSIIGPSGLTGPVLADRIGLHSRATYDFLDALVAQETRPAATAPCKHLAMQPAQRPHR